jgi:hypothetical protein
VNGSNPTRTKQRRNDMVYATTQASAANTAQTLTVARGNKKRIFLKELTFSSGVAAIVPDVTIAVKDNGTTVWQVELLAAHARPEQFEFGKGIPIRNGDLTIVVDAGGATVVTYISACVEVV